MSKFYNNRVRSSIIFNMTITVIYCVVFLTPYLSRNISIFAKLGLMSIWLLSAFASGLNSKTYKDKNVVWWAVYITVMFISTILGHSSLSINFHISRLSIYILPFVGIYVLNKYNYKELSILIKFIFVIIFINLIDNIYLGIINPDLFNEEMVLTASKEIVEKTTNAANTDMVAIVTILTPICYILYKYSSKKRTKIFSFLMIIVSLYYAVFINSRATSLIILLITFAGYILVETESKDPAKLKSHYLWWSIASIVIILVIAMPLMSFFIESLSGRNAERIGDLMALANGEDIRIQNGSLTQRFLLDMTSWRTFTNNIPNFLFGIGDDSSETDLYSLINSGVGQHSEIFDILARFGIIGGLIMYNIFKSSFLNISKRNLTPGKVNHFLVVVFCVFVFYNIVNKSMTTPMFLIVLYIFIPGAIYLLSYNK